MKRLIFVLALAVGLSAGANEITQAVKDLNAAIEPLIAPLRNESTSAQLTFTDIQTNAERAVSLAVSGLYKKTGTMNTLEVRLDDLSYQYGDGSAPTTRIKGFLGLDITKLLPQEQLNRLIPGLEELVQGFAADYVRAYGEAALVKFEVLSKETDPAGNFTSLSAKFEVVLDMAKLPTSVKAEDVWIQAVSVGVSADLKTGLNVNAVVVSNPAHKTFAKDQEGLKEALDRLLSKDPQNLEEIQKLFLNLDQGANRIVNEGL